VLSAPGAVEAQDPEPTPEAEAAESEETTMPAAQAAPAPQGGYGAGGSAGWDGAWQPQGNPAARGKPHKESEAELEADEATDSHVTQAEQAGVTSAGSSPNQPNFHGIEWLPPARELMVRGIPNGSLAQTWHGMQWPHYPHTGLALSGNIWIDSGYARQDRSLSTEQDRRFWLQEGRFLLRATPTYSNGDWFAQAQGELLAWSNAVKGDLPIDVDDAWLKFGRWDKWDVQVGRYEAWEIYHKGMGLERDTLEDQGAFDERDTTRVRIYEVNYMMYRQDGFGQAAFHYYPLKQLRFEVGTLFGNEAGLNALGVRPVGILDLGWLKFKVGGEYRKGRDRDKNGKREDTQRGMGASLMFILFPWFEGGINAAYGVIDRIGQNGLVDEKGSPTTASIGAFANVAPWGKLVIGAGADYSDQDNRQRNDMTGDVGHFQHFQAFGAIQHPIISDSFTAKLVLAYGKADHDESFDNDKHNKAYVARLRLRYVF
jgi:hypothetical protein